MPGTEEIDHEELTAALVEQATLALEGRSAFGSAELLGDIAPIADATLKLLVRDTGGQPVAVVLCSLHGAPGMVARGAERAADARLALGEELGRVILEPLREGEVDGLSFTVMPYCLPFSDSRLLWRMQRRSLRPAIFDWLRSAAKATRAEPTPEELDAGFRAPLAHLGDLGAMPDRVRAAAGRALERLESGRWTPVHVLLHGDLWKSNMLLDRTATDRGLARWRRFVLIDWPGSLVRGHGLYDLVRVSYSLAVKDPALRNELDAHCRILACDPSDCRSHLAAALGYLGLHLEHFPMKDYVRIADACLTAMERIGR